MARKAPGSAHPVRGPGSAAGPLGAVAQSPPGAAAKGGGPFGQKVCRYARRARGVRDEVREDAEVPVERVQELEEASDAGGFRAGRHQEGGLLGLAVHREVVDPAAETVCRGPGLTDVAGEGEWAANCRMPGVMVRWCSESSLRSLS